MVVDAHQHFLFPSRINYPWMRGEALRPLMRDFGPDDLRPLLRAGGVDKTVLVQTRSSLEETREFLRIARATDYVAGVVGWVDLAGAEVGQTLDELRALPEGNFLVGIRHQVHDEADQNWLLRPEVRRGIAELGRRGLAYDFLTRARELPACLETARDFPEVRFVVDHLAKPDIAGRQWEEWLGRIAPLAALPNVWVKLSGLVTEANWQTWRTEDIRPYVQKAVELFGPGRCLFGSDWPVCLLAADYARVQEALGAALPELSDAERRGVFGGNAARAYRLVL